MVLCTKYCHCSSTFSLSTNFLENTIRMLSLTWGRSYTPLSRLLIHRTTTCSLSTLSERRIELEKDLTQLVEHQALQNLKDWLAAKSSSTTSVVNPVASSLPVKPMITSVLSTFLLHYNSRVASACGEGYYTIGPCGEESLSAVALALDNSRDTASLHYRHLGISLMRGWTSRSEGQYDGETLKELLLDRARGYTVSSKDPVTSGNHCCLGGGGKVWD